MIAGRDLSRVPKVSVRRLTAYLKKRLTNDPKLFLLGVQGEVTGLRAQPSGSVNFDIKEGTDVLNCFAYPSDAATFPELANGNAVIVYGGISTYAPRSSYQLVVRAVELAGIGELFVRYEALKKRLDAEGLFRDTRKRPLPKYPFYVALVGSAAGEGTNDFRVQAAERAPQTRVELFETLVQGDVAPQIIAALKRATATQPDLIVLLRGGGSFEALMVFSDERLVRAVAASPVPVATAIGHLGNRPLADLASDLSLPTPSTAALKVMPDRSQILQDLVAQKGRLLKSLGLTISQARSALERVEVRSPLSDRLIILRGRRQLVDGLAEELAQAFAKRIAKRRDALYDFKLSLASVSPTAKNAAMAERLAAFSRRLVPAFRRLTREKTLALRDREKALGLAASGMLWQRRNDLAATSRHLLRLDPISDLKQVRREVAEAQQRLSASTRRVLERRRERFGAWKARLLAGNPEAALRQGYAIVRDAEGKIVTDAAAVALGTRLAVKLHRGELAARVEG